MDLQDKISMGTALFGSSAIDRGASTALAEVASNAENGEVTVYMKDENGNEQKITIPCDGDLRAGDTATVIIQEGTATAISASGAGERSKKETAAAQETATTAQNTAEDAATKATTAQTTAENAATAATAAQKTAETAANAASTAKTKAETAAADASTAKTKAETAASAASTAQTTAENAASAATAAADKAEEEAKRAQAAEKTITDNVDNVKKTADQAVSDIAAEVTRAQNKEKEIETLANTASDAASSAQSSASQAAKDAQAAGVSASLAQAAAEAAQGTADETKKYFYHDSEGAHVISGDTTDPTRLDLTNDSLKISEGGVPVSEFNETSSYLNNGLFVVETNQKEMSDGVIYDKGVFTGCVVDWGDNWKFKSMFYNIEPEFQYVQDGENKNVTYDAFSSNLYTSEDGAFKAQVVVGHPQTSGLEIETLIDSSEIEIGGANSETISIGVNNEKTTIGNSANGLELTGSTIAINSENGATTAGNSSSNLELFGSKINVAGAVNINSDNASKCSTTVGNKNSSLDCVGKTISINNASTAGATYIGNQYKSTSINGSSLNLGWSASSVNVGGTGVGVTSLEGQTITIGTNSISVCYVENTTISIGDSDAELQLKGSKITANGVDITAGSSPLDAYPVGSIYMSVNSTSPATLFGGTWQQLQNSFLVGAGSNYTAGSTGGSATHSHTVNSHTHSMSHTHGISSHSHSLNSHTHSISSHTHTLKHTHDYGVKLGAYNNTLMSANIPNRFYLYNGSNWVSTKATTESVGQPVAYALASTSSTTSKAVERQALTTTTSAASTETTSGTSLTTDKASGSTGSATLSTNSLSATSTGSASPSTNSANNLPPYLAVYMWKRTA